jgi:hypothetical protein
MPLFVTVTPGTTVTSSTTLDASTLNLLGTPSVDVTGTVDGGSITLGVQSVPLPSLYAQADQTIVGNGAGSSASPVALTTTDLVLTATTVNIKAAAVTTAKIADSNVTYAKIQNVASARLLGNSAGTAGVVQELTVGSGLTLSGGALTNGLLRYTTSLKAIPVIGNASQIVQWLTTASELPSTTSSIAPQIVRVVLSCAADDGAFKIGNEIDINSIIVQQVWANNVNLTSTYNIAVSSGVVVSSSTNLFLNVCFSKEKPGNGIYAGDANSQLVYLDNTGSRTVLTRASWQVKAYLLYASTWA